MLIEEALTYDDVLIQPAFSDIETRSIIDISQSFLGRNLMLPIISSNMDYVTGFDMANAMYVNGGLGILNRFYDWDIQVEDVSRLKFLNVPAYISVGTRDNDNSIDKIYQVADDLEGVCIDVAQGHHHKVASLITRIKYDFPMLEIIAGNIATYDGFRFLADAGADAIKVGIGPGSVCTTRTITGVGIPQLTAVINCVEAQQYYDNVSLIADGGIKNSGDIVKALAAGADVVMLGSLLAGTDECPGETRVAPDNSRWRPYQGQSVFGTNGSEYTPEGIKGWVKEKGPVADILKQLAAGIRSGMSYVGAYNLDELRTKAQFIRVSSYTHIESGTRVAESYI